MTRYVQRNNLRGLTWVQRSEGIRKRYNSISMLGLRAAFVNRGAATLRLWLQYLNSLRMNLLVFDFAGVPATAESFDEKDGADHLLA